MREALSILLHLSPSLFVVVPPCPSFSASPIFKKSGLQNQQREVERNRYERQTDRDTDRDRVQIRETSAKFTKGASSRLTGLLLGFRV